MATFKPIIDRMRADGTYNVFIRVTHNRKLAYIPTDYYVQKQYVRKSKRTGLTIHDHRILDKLDAMIKKFMRICDEHDISRMDAKAVAGLVTSATEEDVMRMDFVQYVRNSAEKMAQEGRKGTAVNRIAAINAFCRVFGLDVIPLLFLTRRSVRDALSRIQGKRAPLLYKAQLQAAFNSLMKEYNIDDVVIPYNPFSGIEVRKEEPPVKRALDAETLRAIFNLEDMELREGTKGARFNLAKDVFMLSFLLVGMNSADLFHCSDYKGGRITYERQKTRTRRSDKALISVMVPEEAKPLLDKYLDKKGSGHVFRFWRMYADKGTFNAALNKGLKQVGEAVGIDGLTFYAARHSWATIAVNDCGIDKWTVHLALNHVDPSTAVTDIYIKKSWKPIDEANRKVIDYLLHENSTNPHGLMLPTK